MQDKRYTSGYEILQVSASKHKKKEITVFLHFNI